MGRNKPGPYENPLVFEYSPAPDLELAFVIGF